MASILASWLCCCNQEPTQDAQITLSDAAVDEGDDARVSQLHYSDSSTHFMPSSGSSATPPTGEEDRQKEKERLQDMVKEFAKQVVRGQPCHLLEATANGTRQCAAVYSIDRYLRVFKIEIGANPDDPDHSPRAPEEIEMMLINEVVKDGKLIDSISYNPEGVTDYELRCCCLKYGSPAKELALLLPNTYERDRFLTCMQILRWAMDKSKQQTR